MNTPVLDNAAFKAYAATIKTESEKQTGNSNFAPREYEDIKWMGLETGVNKFCRCVGQPPRLELLSLTRNPEDPVEIVLCTIKDDQGKRMELKLPLRADTLQNDHIIHRLYAKVTEAEWVNKKKINKYESKYPELWAAVTKTGYNVDRDGKSFTFANGLKGQKTIIMNVIDRSDEWCAENKHTKLLSKEVNVGEDKDGNPVEYPKTGVPSFGFVEKLAEVMAKYGLLTNYDLAIKKTGEKTAPYEVRNISKLKEKDMLEDVLNDDGSEIEVDKIIIGPLTEAELSYDAYDVEKYYKPTTYRQILKRIPSVFKLCDACLGSTFYDELESLVAKEKAEWDAQQESQKADEPAENAAIRKAKRETEELNEAAEEKPASSARRSEPVSDPTEKRKILTDEKIAALKGWGKLTGEQKSWIDDVKLNPDGTVKEIVWIAEKTIGNLYCDNCNVMSPPELTTCPSCGSDFS
jgi:hypothetical protein